MRPVTVLIGIVPDSSASITLGPGAARAVFAIPAGKHPGPPHERPPVESLLACAVLTAASAGSFLEQAQGVPPEPVGA